MRSPDPGSERKRLRPTSGRAVATAAMLGLAVGWAVHPLLSRLGDQPPLVSWVQALSLVLAGAIMSFLAWHTWMTVQVRREVLEPHRAVNRLVLARACVLGASLVGAGYLGYAVSWLGDNSQLADQRILRSLVAASGAAVVTIASLVLERACRADVDEPQP